MDRLIATNSVPFASRDLAPGSGTPQYATSGNPVGPVPATVWPAYAFNAIQDEIIAVINAAGITPDKANWAQLLKAMQTLTRGNNIAVYKINAGVQQVSINGAAFTATGATTFAAPPGGAAKVRIWGGGGGAGGSSGAGAIAGSGGGGEYAEGIFTGLVSPTTITVGAGGAAGTAAPTNGSSGGPTSFGALMTAAPGTFGNAVAGAAAAAAGSGGGTGIGGTFRVAGGNAAAGVSVGGFSFCSVPGGSFGVSIGLQSINTSATVLPGVGALFPGGGGGGSNAGGASQAGASGCVIVEW